MSIVANTSQAVDFNLGLYSFYAFWEPSCKNQAKDYKCEPFLLWGPFVSVTFFQKLGFSFLALQNYTSMAETSYVLEGVGEVSAYPYKVKAETKTARLDLDFTVSYKITPALGLFAGYKWTMYGEEEYEHTCEPAVFTVDVENVSDNMYQGPALGFTYTFALTGSLFLTAGGSFIYVVGEYTPIRGFEELSAGHLYDEEIDKSIFGYKGIGGNATLNLSYYIDAISTSIILGGRFQAFKYYADSDLADITNDYFYGVTLAAVLHL